MPEGWALVDGQMIPLEQATWPATDPAVTVGYSVFETMRSDAAGALHRVPHHMDRLRRSARRMGIVLPPLDRIADEMRQVAVGVGVPAKVRVTISGSGRYVITGEVLEASRWQLPIRAVRGAWRDDPFLGGAIKHGSRAGWVAEVRRTGADDVLLVDAEGRFTEGTNSAILAVMDGVLWTAPHDGRILESTTCLDVLERAASQGVPIRREGPPADGPWAGLYIASTTRDLAPVVELDGQAIAGWEPIGRALSSDG
jgi:branched-subunit amino acid aminotransferase/4-amino-4-deoxychorismate lyase